MKSESITSGPSSSGSQVAQKGPKQPLSELWKNICPKEKHINISLTIKSSTTSSGTTTNSSCTNNNGSSTTTNSSSTTNNTQ